MIIELYGLPGSGKSTFARRLELEGKGTVVRIASRFELVWRNLLFLFCHPMAFLFGLWHVTANAGGSRLWYYKLMNSFLQCNAKYQKARQYPIAIVDQGFFQNILSIFERPLNNSEARRFLERFPHPDKLLAFVVPESRRQQFLKQRDFVQRSQFGAVYRERWEKVVAQNDRTLRHLVGKMQLCVIFITDPAEAMAPSLLRTGEGRPSAPSSAEEGR